MEDIKSKMTMENNFEEQVENAMREVVEKHQHHHPQYKPTEIVSKKLDVQNGRAAFVLFEQIDVEGLAFPIAGHGGDQYRYSLWYIENGKKPRQIYKNCAWTGGRYGDKDCRIDILGLPEGEIMARISSDKKGMHDRLEVLFTPDGKIREPEDFMKQVENLITRIAPGLGCGDYLKETKKLQGRDIAASIFSSEDGSTYGFDTLYLVYRDMLGKLKCRELKDTRDTKNSLSIESMVEEVEDIVIKTFNIGETRNIEELRTNKKLLGLL